MGSNNYHCTVIFISLTITGPVIFFIFFAKSNPINNTWKYREPMTFMNIIEMAEKLRDRHRSTTKHSIADCWELKSCSLYYKMLWVVGYTTIVACKLAGEVSGSYCCPFVLSGTSSSESGPIDCWLAGCYVHLSSENQFGHGNLKKAPNVS